MICHCLADQLFDLLATDKSKPRDEMIQGAYLFVILHVKHKKNYHLSEFQHDF